MYQCLATNTDSSAQAMAELRLGGKWKTLIFYLLLLLSIWSDWRITQEEAKHFYKSSINVNALLITIK